MAPLDRRVMRRETRTGLFFISPGIFYFFVFWTTPVLLAVFYAFTDWKVRKTVHFVGLKNFTSLASDPLLFTSLVASAKITLIAVTATTLIALALANLLNDDHLFGGRLMRLLIILPFVTDWVATGLVWQLIFLPNSGVLA